MSLCIHYLQRGFTLTEVVVIVAILSILAGVAAPAFTPARLSQLDIARSELSNAIKFARNESVRTRIPHGVDINTNNLTIKLFQLNRSTNPPERRYIVREPLTKNLYVIDFSQSSIARLSSISIANTFHNTCNSNNYIVFDENGLAYCADPYGVLLTNSDINLMLDQHTQTITITPANISTQ